MTLKNIPFDDSTEHINRSSRHVHTALNQQKANVHGLYHMGSSLAA